MSGATRSLVLAAAVAALAGCSKPEKTSAKTAADSSVVAAMSALSAPQQPAVPKVPFGNQPCESITAADASALGMPKVTAKPDRAPANLPIDNVCSYTDGGTVIAQVGYQMEIDFRVNHGGNRSTTRGDPAEPSGAFYDKQGGVWFTKNGYYVVVSGQSRFREAAAKLIAGKL